MAQTDAGTRGDAWTRDVRAYPADGDCFLLWDGSVFPASLCDHGPGAPARWSAVEPCFRAVRCDAGIPWRLECRHPYAEQVRSACQTLSRFEQVCTLEDARLACQECVAVERSGSVCFRR